ncbi:MAG: arginine--tRNA ligase [Chloroflexota bacterium]
MQESYLRPKVAAALEKLGWGGADLITFDIPKNPEHGDLSLNIAMKLAKTLGKNPRQVAMEVIEALEYDAEAIANPEIAGPGFINFKFTGKFYTDALGQILSEGGSFGRSSSNAGKRVNVEYVSVNPTGLLHLGHGRNACFGDAVANLYQWTGYEVTREYYFNNAGNQMKNLAKSVHARYVQMVNPDFEFPENGYHGEYVKTIAELFREERGEGFEEETTENLLEFQKFGEKWCFERITHTLARMNIRQDVFYNEDSLYSEGKIKEVIQKFRDLGLVYEKDGATWLKFSELGLESDRVIIKSTGEPTYRLPDIAYHVEKFKRGFDLLVDVFGADHIATIPDVLAAVKALGYDPAKVNVLIHQFVTLTENGEQVKMSKRTGKSYTLDELLDEVGEDVVRFFLIMRSVGTHLEFDLALAREQSDKNPVFYLQYAHARISSIFEKAREASAMPDNFLTSLAEGSANVDLNLLRDPAEIDLVKKLARFPIIVAAAAEKNEPHALCEYLREIAVKYHAFYHDCRVITDDAKLTLARLALCRAAQTALKNGLTILGVSAPDKM